MKNTNGFIDTCLGLQWGDEGKGKVVDYLAKDYAIVARFQGGPNAGHTLWHNGKKIVLHNLPSGILHEHVLNFIGPGCVVNPATLMEEIKNVANILGLTPGQIKQRIFVSKHAFIIHPYHQYLDKAMEVAKGNASVGTTGRGIGPVYSDIKDRVAFRFGDYYRNDNFFFSEEYKLFVQQTSKELNFYAKEYGYSIPDKDETEEHYMQPYYRSLAELRSWVTFVDMFWLEDQLNSGKKVLAEGAQGTMLDNNFGCYPMVTSSNTVSGGAPVGLGVPMKYFRKTIGVMKWYTTKVGSGEFPSEITDAQTQQMLQQAGGEVGATTGRPRRCGWLDIPQLLYALRINAVDELIMTKVDINPLSQVEVVSSYILNIKAVNGPPKVGTDFPFTLAEISSPVTNAFDLRWKKEEGKSMLETDLRVYLKYVQERITFTGTKITHISHGPNRDDIEEVHLTD